MGKVWSDPMSLAEPEPLISAQAKDFGGKQTATDQWNKIGEQKQSSKGHIKTPLQTLAELLEQTIASQNQPRSDYETRVGGHSQTKDGWEYKEHISPYEGRKKTTKNLGKKIS